MCHIAWKAPCKCRFVIVLHNSWSAHEAKQRSKHVSLSPACAPNALLHHPTGPESMGNGHSTLLLQTPTTSSFKISGSASLPQQWLLFLRAHGHLLRDCFSLQPHWLFYSPSCTPSLPFWSPSSPVGIWMCSLLSQIPSQILVHLAGLHRGQLSPVPNKCLPIWGSKREDSLHRGDTRAQPWIRWPEPFL